MKSNPVNSNEESATPEIKEAVSNWASAYVTDDRDSLKSIVRDPSGESVFIGMNGPR